ncbi:hypothetical protein L596_015226 [Steinernema carpocapsae]|uniref:Uncharacterized protein n=1 Tax=Steinernema carpocapsae TaxID=34508 RepID=A0A4U5NFC8_STECR|nr:hypothetical protein L596_015226 [Steinernema carpocapsae]
MTSAPRTATLKGIPRSSCRTYLATAAAATRGGRQLFLDRFYLWHPERTVGVRTADTSKNGRVLFPIRPFYVCKKRAKKRCVGERGLELVLVPRAQRHKTRPSPRANGGREPRLEVAKCKQCRKRK